MLKKIARFGAHLFLVAFVALVIASLVTSTPRHAVAQSQPSPTDRVACNSVALGATSAVIVTASSGSSYVIKALKCASTTAGTVTFQDGNEGAAIGIIYLAANTPTEIPAAFWAPYGCATTAGNGIYAIGTGTLSVQLVYGSQ